MQKKKKKIHSLRQHNFNLSGTKHVLKTYDEISFPGISYDALYGVRHNYLDLEIENPGWHPPTYFLMTMTT